VRVNYEPTYRLSRESMLPGNINNEEHRMPEELMQNVIKLKKPIQVLIEHDNYVAINDSPINMLRG
jgi:hypothetical protein